MKEIAAAKFKAQCLSLLDEVDDEGIIITKRGKPVAKLVRFSEHRSNKDLIGSMKGRIIIDPDDDLSTADAWDEWTGEDLEDPSLVIQDENGLYRAHPSWLEMHPDRPFRRD